MKIAVLSVALLAGLQIFLGLNISRLRRKHKVSAGHPEDVDHPLTQACTAFRNCCEWHPMFMALMLVLPMGGAPAWSVWLPAGVVLARCLLVYALLFWPLSRPNTLRVLGATLNYLFGGLLVALVAFAYWM